MKSPRGLLAGRQTEAAKGRAYRAESLRVAEAGLVIRVNVALLADAAAYMLCRMGQGILLFGTAMAWRAGVRAARVVTDIRKPKVGPPVAVAYSPQLSFLKIVRLGCRI